MKRTQKYVRHICALNVARHLFENPQRAGVWALAGCKPLVINDHPLVVVRAAIVLYET